MRGVPGPCVVSRVHAWCPGSMRSIRVHAWCPGSMRGVPEPCVVSRVHTCGPGSMRVVPGPCVRVHAWCPGSMRSVPGPCVVSRVHAYCPGSMRARVSGQKGYRYPVCCVIRPRGRFPTGWHSTPTRGHARPSSSGRVETKHLPAELIVQPTDRRKMWVNCLTGGAHLENVAHRVEWTRFGGC